MKIFNGVEAGLVILSSVLLAPAGAFAAITIQNGSFETPLNPATDWSSSLGGVNASISRVGSGGFTTDNGQSVNPVSGSWFAIMHSGNPGGFTTLTSQPFTAVAGDTISVSALFDAGNSAPDGSNSNDHAQVVIRQGTSD